MFLTFPKVYSFSNVGVLLPPAGSSVIPKAFASGVLLRIKIIVIVLFLIPSSNPMLVGVI